VYKGTGVVHLYRGTGIVQCYNGYSYSSVVKEFSGITVVIQRYKGCDVVLW